MENYHRQMTGEERYRGLPDERTVSESPMPEERASMPPARLGISSLAVGAKTVAGIGIGLIVVVAGSAVIGVAAETILIPSLLIKLAGGIAGGGVGMAKGLKDAQKVS